MFHRLLTALAVATVAVVAGGATADEAHAQVKKRAPMAAKYYKKRTVRRGGVPRVAGYVQRRGGYSYSPADVINTGGDSRTRFGSANAYRTWTGDRQTISGPFDHGFFFDSGATSPRGGNSTNMN